jgi:hypothetical protein
VLEQVVLDHDIAGCAPGELFMLFSIGIGFVVDDEVDDGRSPV